MADKPAHQVSAETNRKVTDVLTPAFKAYNAVKNFGQQVKGVADIGQENVENSKAIRNNMQQLDEAKKAAAPALKLPSYKHGTASVPKDGPAMLHKGEAVIPKEHNPFARVADLAVDKDKPKKEIKHITHRKAGKGFIIEHHHTHPEHHPMEEHVAANKKEMLSHIDAAHPEEAAETGSEAQDEALGISPEGAQEGTQGAAPEGQ